MRKSGTGWSGTDSANTVMNVPGLERGLYGQPGDRLGQGDPDEELVAAAFKVLRRANRVSAGTTPTCSRDRRTARPGARGPDASSRPDSRPVTG